LEHYFFFYLVPLTFVLAWQDWKSKQVNLVLAITTVIILALHTHYPHHSFFMFGILWIYQRVRKNSIQLIDIALFSLGAGYFSILFLPAYCLITAISLIMVFKIKQELNLPFIASWIIGFWGTYILKLYVN